jgi:hypothetical protein
VIAIDRDAIIFFVFYENFTVNGVPQTERFWIPKSSVLLIKPYKPNAEQIMIEPSPGTIRLDVQT